MGLNNYIYAFPKALFEASKQDVDSFVEGLITDFNNYYDITYRPNHHTNWNDLEKSTRREVIKYDSYLKSLLQQITNHTCDDFDIEYNGYVLHERVNFIEYLSNIWDKSEDYITVSDWRKNYDLDTYVRDNISNEEAFPMTQQHVDIIREAFPDINLKNISEDPNLIYIWVSSR